MLPDELPAAERLERAAHYTAKYLYGHFRRRPEVQRAGATLTAVLVRDEVATIAQVGDSRAYLLRGDRAEQITRDQTLAQALIDSGAIEPGAPGVRPRTPRAWCHSARSAAPGPC